MSLITGLAATGTHVRHTREVDKFRDDRRRVAANAKSRRLHQHTSQAETEHFIDRRKGHRA